MTEENPFEAPEANQSTEINDTDSRDYLRKIAKGQRSVLLAVLFQLGIVMANILVVQMGHQIPFVSLIIILIPLLVLGNFVVIVFSVFRLAASLDGTLLAILWVVFSIIPCLGLLFLLIISQRATNVLTKNGIKVGFLGADVSSI